MTPTEAKLKAVRDWAKPHNVRDILSFLGFANYYRRFVKNFTGVVGTLMDLTRKNVPWQWGPYQRQAFEQLKDALCTAPVLLFLDPQLPYIMVTNASGSVAGGVLMQDQGMDFNLSLFLVGSSSLRNRDIQHMSENWRQLYIVYKVGGTIWRAVQLV